MNNNFLKTEIGRLKLQSPLLTASGTSGSSNELALHKDYKKTLKHLGAFVTKGVTIDAHKGNKPIRIVETRYGIINSIGLQNKGVESFHKKELPELLKYNLPVIVNISAGSIEGFATLAKYMHDSGINEEIGGIEINVSCPNLKKGGMSFGVDPHSVEQIVKNVKNAVGNRVVVITKLSPNVTDITVPAVAAINGGSDALSMINTLRAMAIDIEKKKPVLGNIVGGLSGPCIKPVGLFMVYECFRKIKECNTLKVPIIGIGGVSDYSDALEYIMAGASAVAIGTEWFNNNSIFQDISKNMYQYLVKNKCTLIELIGIAHK